MRSDLAAFGAVFLWASLATLGAALDHLPPLLITGISLIIGSLIALPLVGFRVKKMIVSPKILLLGVYGLFGYHVALFAGLQQAPAVQANLVNYLWPLLIVLLAPLFIRSAKLTLRLVLAGIAGFLGAGLAILSGTQLSGNFEIGYLWAGIAAIIWATYSLGTKRAGKFPTAAVGLFGLVAGALALLVFFATGGSATISTQDWIWLIALGLGPLGGSFFLWDFALKNGDAQRIGLIAFITPLLSTVMLLVFTGSPLSPLLLLAATLIIGGAALGSRVNN